MKHLILTTAPGGIQLAPGPPARPTPPGGSITVQAALQTSAPMVFVGVRFGANPSIRQLGPQGIEALGGGGAWRVDEILIDGVSPQQPLDATWYNGDSAHTGRERPFGVGREIVMIVTNVGDAPAYFTATWDLEDLQ